MSQDLVLPSNYQEMTYDDSLQDGGFNWKNAVGLAVGVAMLAAGSALIYSAGGVETGMQFAKLVGGTLLQVPGGCTVFQEGMKAYFSYKYGW